MKTIESILKITGVLIMVVLINGGVFAQDGSGGLMKRENIDPKYTWNLKDIYVTESEWQADFDWIKANLGKYKDYEGRLASDPQKIVDLFKFDEEVSIKFGKVYLYSSLSKDLDLANTKYQGMFEEVSALAADFGTMTSFIRPELLSIPEETLWKYVEGDDFLKIYKQSFDNLLRSKAHSLPKVLCLNNRYPLNL